MTKQFAPSDTTRRWTIGARRTRAWIGWFAMLLTAGVLGVFFGRWAFVPPGTEAVAEQVATVRVAEMTVGQFRPVPVSATWDMSPLGVGASDGTLTSIEIADTTIIDVGDVVYSVDLRPVIVAEGAVPAFRALTQGARVDDVTQLQQLLTTLGYFTGAADGHFQTSTTRAVRSWQRDLGVQVDGVVRAGDIVFTDRLPTRVALAEGMEVGRRIAPGDVVLNSISAEPRFIANPQWGGEVDPDNPIEVQFGGETVLAYAVAQMSDGGGNTLLELRRLDGLPVCGDRCDEVPLERSEAIFSSRQVLVAPATGPGVPASAIWLEPDGTPFLVRADDGTRIPVTIVSQGQGQVVLGGVDLGVEVVLANQTVPDGQGE